jgi:hypothetical protein
VLPAEPTGWLRRVFDPRPVPVLVADAQGVPKISNAADGLYHGERLDVAGIADLGQHLQKLLQNSRLAPRVVFHIAGSGPHMMSPVQVRGVKELVLYFEPVKDAKKTPPLLLEADPRTASRTALFDIEGGSLDLLGARIQFSNDRAALVPPYIIKIQGGDLRLARCQLRGPLSRAPDAFRSLIFFKGAGLDAARPAALSVRDSLLLSGKSVLQLSDAGSVVRMRNNIAMALGSGAIDIDAPARLGKIGGISCAFEQNTWAIRHGFLALHAGAEFPSRGEPVVVQTTANYFLDPFGELPSQAVIVRYQESALAHGYLSWQGRKNIFDLRLQGFFAPLPPVLPERQTPKDWTSLWGPNAEQEALLVGPVQLPRLVAINPDQPDLARLALPRDPRFNPLQPPAGADLLHLGALWAK